MKPQPRHPWRAALASVRSAKPRSAWIAASTAVYGLIVLLHAVVMWLPAGDAEASTLFRSVYGVLYFLWGILLLGAIARIRPQAGALLWRPLMLATAASLALIEFWLTNAAFGRPQRLETWMTAVLGIALAAMLPRLLPQGWLRRWLDQDRRRNGYDRQGIFDHGEHGEG